MGGLTANHFNTFAPADLHREHWDGQLRRGGLYKEEEDTRHFARGIVSQKDRAWGKQRKAKENPARVSTKGRAIGKDFWLEM